MTPTAAIVKDRTGLYFSVPKEIIKETNGYDSFHVSSEVVVSVMDDPDGQSTKGNHHHEPQLHPPASLVT